jgi:hypothetical protein
MLCPPRHLRLDNSVNICRRAENQNASHYEFSFDLYLNKNYYLNSLFSDTMKGSGRKGMRKYINICNYVVKLLFLSRVWATKDGVPIFEIFKAVNTKMTVLLDVAACALIECYQCFGKFCASIFRVDY